ncbi:MAG: pentapeptide repeat-containing protein [Candidatus Omnitrophica bacterium]|nr:pentapeptide repeat-containing protein [Candidatus Omnitrophota bacterium]
MDFSDVTFEDEANFFAAKFTQEAKFFQAIFSRDGDFSLATFSKGADFTGATFTEWGMFIAAKFLEGASFSVAEFSKRATFDDAAFSNGAYFDDAIFLGGASFKGVAFEGGDADFRSARFLGRTFFVSRQEGQKTIPIFSGVKVDFMEVIVNSPDAVTFLEADLRRCQLLDTDLRRIQFTGVIWPQLSGRIGVYDEIAPLKMDEDQPWARIEWVYRELKQNYEDRRDYERAGDFHYGEKEMRRQNPETPVVLRFLLTLYWLFSGYGERYIRPLIWAGVLLMLSTFSYLVLGLKPKDGGTMLVLTSVWDWLRAAHYSLRVMTLLRPEDLIAIGFAKVVNTIASLVGPLFLGLFALAVRQRLKR